MTYAWIAALLVLLPRAGAAQDKAAAAPKPKIAVVIDDFGLTYPRNQPDDDWMKLPFPLTFAVMPQSPRTKKAAIQTKEAGKELIIHFPFDPFLTLDLDKTQATEGDMKKVRDLMDKAFKQIAAPVGLNNHRSLNATKNRPLMAWFMRELKPRNVYFLDSWVSPRSVAYDEAKKAAIPAARGIIFLEEPKHYSKEFVARMLRVAAAHAKKHGSAIAIGHHYYKSTYEGVAEEIPRLQKEGFEFVFASALAR
ncbi:MAG: divergent polysaccharide deacetylase family protein [Elusimicrobia bacterium]|nr:divergent polysaccharide deacetylase family protein [Elusimicrobiota bacterium]